MVDVHHYQRFLWSIFNLSYNGSQSLGRLKTIRTKTDFLHPPPPPPPSTSFASKQSCILQSCILLYFTALLCLEKCLLIPTLFGGGRGRSLEVSKLLQKRMLCYICVFEGRIFGLYCSFETLTFYSNKSRGGWGEVTPAN